MISYLRRVRILIYLIKEKWIYYILLIFKIWTDLEDITKEWKIMYISKDDHELERISNIWIDNTAYEYK